MTTAEYKIEASKKYDGLYKLTETIHLNGKTFIGFEAWFDVKGLAICHAKKMMCNKGDKIVDVDEGVVIEEILETLS